MHERVSKQTEWWKQHEAHFPTSNVGSNFQMHLISPTQCHNYFENRTKSNQESQMRDEVFEFDQVWKKMLRFVCTETGLNWKRFSFVLFQGSVSEANNNMELFVLALSCVVMSNVNKNSLKSWRLFCLLKAAFCAVKTLFCLC